MHFLDLTYFYLHHFYKVFNDKNPGDAASSLLGAILAFNVLTIAWLYELNTGKDVGFTQYWVIILTALVFQVFSLVRYTYLSKVNITEFEARIGKKTTFSRNVIRNICISYIILSLVSFFGLVIYLGNNKP